MSKTIIICHIRRQFSGADNTRNFEYVGGIIVEYCWDPNSLNFLDLMRFCKDKWYFNVAKLHYKIWKPTRKEQDSLKLVYNDEILVPILHLAFERIPIKIFVEHGKED